MAKKSRKPAHTSRRATDESKLVAISATLQKTLADELDAFAARKGWSRSKTIAQAVRTLLKSDRG